MDKFGIFKLLNSFLGQTENNSSENQPNPAEERSTPKNFLSDLFSNINANNSKRAEQVPPPPNQKPVNFKPLQNQMLTTMKSHDQIVKRIKSKQP